MRKEQKQYNDEANARLWGAIESYNFEECKKAIEDGADINATKRDGRAPLHHAACVGNLAIVELLLDHGADVRAVSDYGYTPFFYASFYENLAIAELLLKYYYNEATVRFLEALKNFDYEAAEEAIEDKADINAKDGQGRTPLHRASLDGNLAIVEFLLKHGANISAKDDLGNTSLYWGACVGNLAIVELLLDRGAVINSANKDDETPLHSAVGCCTNKKALVELLLDRGAVVNSVSKSGQTPLHLAACYGNLAIVELLLQRGAEVNVVNKNGDTPLNWAVKNVYKVKVIEYLCENGAIVTQDIIDEARNQQGYLLTHLVTAQWCQDILSNQPSDQDIRTIPVDLIQRVMRGQLKLIGSIEKLLEVKTIQNEIIQEIFTEDFVNEVEMAIVKGRKIPELYEAIKSGKYADDLTNLSVNAQKIISDELKDLLHTKPFMGDYQKLKHFADGFGSQIGDFLSSEISTFADQIKADRSNLAQDFQCFLGGKLVLDATEIYDEIDASEAKTDKEAANSFLKDYNSNPQKLYELELSADLGDPSDYLLNPDLIPMILDKMNNLAHSQENYKGRDNDIRFYEFLNGPILDEKSNQGFLNNLDKHFLPHEFNLKVQELRKMMEIFSESMGIESIRNMMIEEVTKMSSNNTATKIQKTDIVYDAHNKLSDQEMDVEPTGQTYEPDSL